MIIYSRLAPLPLLVSSPWFLETVCYTLITGEEHWENAQKCNPFIGTIIHYVLKTYKVKCHIIYIRTYLLIWMRMSL